ncbi:hypothetical protein MWH25_08500 [Natroniella acetigena]|uniref:hypothetical protein n=1 Tax=Natroniella acetigena TaxID=52004 RepID=UPI00200A5503|nr:hypothetical protein [Natroniella acetigena]MCK8827779.1 hypothetical protein [Natroniella acetigena]
MRIIKSGLVGLLLVMVLSLVGCRNQELTTEEAKTELEPQIGIVDLADIRREHPLTQQIAQIEERIVNLNLSLREEEESLTKIEEDTGSYLTDFNQQVKRRLEVIEADYAKKIEQEESKLGSKLEDYYQQLMAEFESELAEKETSLHQELKDELLILEKEYDTDLEEYKAIIDQNYNSEIINLRLQLRVANLDEAKQNQLQSQLEELTAEREAKIEDQEQYYNQKLQSFLQQEEAELQQRLQDYQQKLLFQAEADYETRKQELELEFYNYLTSLEEGMVSDLSSQEEELAANIEEELLAAREKLITRVETRVKDLTDEIIQLQQKREKLRSERKEELDLMIEQVAEDKGLALILTDYNQNLAAIDLTEEILAEIRLGG